MKNLNVFGQPLIACSTNPMTGFFRDGCCSTNEEDFGVHTVCIARLPRVLENNILDYLVPLNKLRNIN